MLLNSLLSVYAEKVKNPDGETVGYLYKNVWTDYAKNTLSSVFLYAAIALAVLLIGIAILVRFKKREALPSYAKTAICIAVGFAVTVIIAMFSLELMHMQEKGRVHDLIVYPAATLMGVVILGAAAIYTGSLFGKKALKIAAYTAGGVALAALVALLVCVGVYYGQEIAADGYYNSDVASVNQVVLYLSAVIVLAGIIALGFVFDRGKRGFDSKSISYAAVCIALSFALSYLKIFEMPQGGSVTIASLLPLMIYSFMFGTKKGVFAGVIYGILQAVQDPYIIHPAQFLLDYPVAFSAIGLAGMFANVKTLEKLPQVQFALGAIAASALRFVSHVLSGVFAFSAYAVDAGMETWVYSLGYNSFVFVDIAIVIAAGILVFSSPAIVKQARKFQTVKKPAEEATTAETDEETGQ